MSEIKILILGDGQLGSYVYNMYNWILKNLNITLCPYPSFDITSREKIEKVLNAFEWDIVINAAAYTFVDNAESDQYTCAKVNAWGPIMLTSECIKRNLKLVHISTEAVYGSNDPKYVPLCEDDEKYPVNVYAKTKNDADEYIENMHSDKILLLRPGWLFGPNNDHNFVEKIKRVILSKDKIKVVDDQIGTMTYVGLILKAIEAFIEGRLPAGTYNIGNPEYPSRYDVACFVRDSLRANCEIDRCSSDEYKRLANVAKNSCLDCSKIKKFVDISESWQEDVLKVLKN